MSRVRLLSPESSSLSTGRRRLGLLLGATVILSAGVATAAPALTKAPKIKGKTKGPTIQVTRMSQANIKVNMIEGMLEKGGTDREATLQVDHTANGGNGKCQIWIGGAKRGAATGTVRINVRAGGAEKILPFGSGGVRVMGEPNRAFDVAFKPDGGSYSYVQSGQVFWLGIESADRTRIRDRFEELKGMCPELVAEKAEASTSPYNQAEIEFKNAMLNKAHWSLPRPNVASCVFSQNTQYMGWNDQANFSMKLQASGTTVTAVGSSSIKIKCAGDTNCVTGKGNNTYQNERTIPVAQGKASKAVSSIAQIRSLVPSCQ